MSFHFVPLPGKVRFMMEVEDEHARAYWLETQADFLLAGITKESFDAYAAAYEDVWCGVAQSMREEGENFRASSMEESATGLPRVSCLPSKLQERLRQDVGAALTRIRDVLARIGPEYEHGEYLAEIALVHGMQAGLTRYFQCAHFSPVRPSARVAMLLDPAVNLAGHMELEASTSQALALLPNCLSIAAEDLSRSFAPVRVSSVRARIFTKTTPKQRSDAKGKSTFRRMTFEQLWMRMLEDRPHTSPLPTEHVTAGVTWSKEYRKSFGGFVKLLTKHFGDRPVASLEEADWFPFFAILDRLPKTHHKSKHDADRTLREIIATADREVAGGKLDPVKVGISAVALNKKVSHCRVLYDFLAEHVEVPVIHWSQFERKKPKPNRDRGYSFEEMKQFFELPIYWGRSKASGPLERGTTVWHNAAYWVMLFAAYSGARVGEIAGLTVDDVKVLGGIWYVELRDSSLRSLKRLASVRDLPIHPELIRLGFLDFVHSMREAGECHLFRELHSEGRSLTCGFGELVGKFIKRSLPFIEEGELCHPVRHYVSEELRLADVPEETREAIIGHLGAEDLSERRHSLPHLERVLEALIKLPNLTSALQPHPILLHPEALRTRRKRPDLAHARNNAEGEFNLRVEGSRA